LALVAAGLACSAPLGQGGATLSPSELEAALVGTFGALASQTAALLPTSTATPPATATITSTPTPEELIGELTADTNCRTGPFSFYPFVVTVRQGELVKVLGVNAAGDYWYVTAPNGLSCWMWTRYARVTGNAGNVLPLFTPPPTPFPDWTGMWNVWINGYAATMALTQTGIYFSGTLNAELVYEIQGGQVGNRMNASGSIVHPDKPTLHFRSLMLDNRDQFQGFLRDLSDTVVGEWCGARNGASQPSPCEWIP
jgi:uncharacterized protein YraI